jgi:hypothetical protein
LQRKVRKTAMIRRTLESGGEMNIHEATQSYEKLAAQLYARRRNSSAIEAQANEKKPLPLFPRDVLPVGSTLAGGMRQPA